MKRIAATIIIFAFLAVWVQSMQQQETQTEDLPGVQWLGEGPNTYTIGPNQNFIVKRPIFTFHFEPSPTYTAVGDERVWAISGFNAAPPELFEEWVDLEDKPAGCVVRYVGIDDDLDGRRGYFYLDDDIVHTVTEGMVFSGEFILERAGNLRFYAEDSVGGWIDACAEIIEPTPEPTETPTETPSPTITNTPEDPTETPTQDPSVTPSITPSATATNDFTPTPTNTSIPPTVTATNTPGTPTITATPTKKPRLNTCFRINFEVGGQHAKQGLYVVQETGGHVLAEWYAEDGWMDSGWFKDIDITFEAVYVQVLYYSGPGADPIDMVILNPAPDTPYGWVSRGTCHAIEVAWPTWPFEPPPPPEINVDESQGQTGEQQSPPPPPPEEPTEESSSSLSYGGLSNKKKN